jgi:UDP-N-acetylmuramate dehydrogenase
MKKHTYIKVGGNASVLFIPQTQDELVHTVQFLYEEKIPYKVIGNGSNLLVSDQDFKGVIIKNTKACNHLEVHEDHIIVGSSYPMIKLSYELAKTGLAGLEYISGIPGTVGGGLYMNAGAYNKELKDDVIWVKYMDPTGQVHILDNKDCHYAYRTSVFKETLRDAILLEAKISVTPGDREVIMDLIKRRKVRRVEAQPLNYPSCGSVFKNPKGTHAYLFIDQVGLRGYRIGGAQFSPKHCNFIINDQDATAKNVKDLIELAIEKVYEECQLQLIPEVEFFNF